MPEQKLIRIWLGSDDSSANERLDDMLKKYKKANFYVKQICMDNASRYALILFEKYSENKNDSI